MKTGNCLQSQLQAAGILFIHSHLLAASENKAGQYD
jgi:hypothetical protein